MKDINKIIKSGIRVDNMLSNNGREVPNQFIIRTGYGTMFRSYNSNIAFIPADEQVIYLGSDWDYSRTTMKYLSSFLGGRNKKEIEALIKTGKAIVMEDL